MDILKISADDNSFLSLSKPIEVLSQGGVIIIPTDTVYGIICDINNPDAIQKIYHIKRRDTKKPLPVFINDINQLNFLVDEIPAAAKVLTDNFWPGPLTLLLSCHKLHYSEVTRNSGKMGIRMPGLPLILELIDQSKIVLASTSANLSNEPATYRIDDISKEVLEQVDLVLDGGILELEFHQRLLI